MKNRSYFKLGLITIVSLLIISGFILYKSDLLSKSASFDGLKAYQHVQYQIDLGVRTPGSLGHQQAITWMTSTLQKNSWQVEVQKGEYQGQTIQNVIARRGSGVPWFIIGAHYDTRFSADNDPDITKQSLPVPGANDGASGVAVLLELSRVLSKQQNGQVWLVFFDAEDQGRIPGWDWILGSRFFVSQLDGKPDAVIIIDMIGDADLNIYMERSSDKVLTENVWQSAAELGHAESFIPTYKYSILDDHTPFLEKGIRAIDIIDFDYPYWHTVGDTTDKVSPESLQIVGDTLQTWLEKQK